jgi:hypothetical protein
MESVVRKCLNVREKCFEVNSCPVWLLTILPTRITSIESINDNDNEQQSKEVIDLSPFKLVSSIPLLNQENLNYIYQINNDDMNSNFEYPNDLSFENEQLNNSYQFISSPSNQQLNYLFKKLKQFQQQKIQNPSHQNKDLCKHANCSNHSIPLTSFCKIHLLENDQKQILFDKCNHCQQLSVHHDNTNILHFCSFFK